MTKIPTPKKARIFLNQTGQEDNIGDIILRRGFTNIIRGNAEIHSFVGRHSKDYCESLCQEGDVLYTSKKKWLIAMAMSALSQKTHYFEKPGELQAKRWSPLQVVALNAVMRLLHIRGGRAFFTGIGFRRMPAGIEAKLARWMLSPFTLIAWRDVTSQRSLALGTTMPDWAFAEYQGEAVGAARPGLLRDKLVVSFRSDRPQLSPEWVKAVANWAKLNNLEVVTTWQVARDKPKAEFLADCLGGTYLDFSDDTESRLRELYRSAKVVLSDRLHVLIVASLEGALPVSITEWPEEKIGRHFAAAGYEKVSYSIAPSESSSIDQILSLQFSRAPELERSLSSSKARIDEVAKEILQSMAC